MDDSRYAVLVWAVTSGAQGESLGSDESDTVALGWNVFDIANTKVVLSQIDYVKPRRVDINHNVNLSDDCRLYNVTEENLFDAQPLDQIVDKFIALIQTRLDCCDSANFHLVTDGQLHLRQVLHPEAARNNIQLPECFYSFFDIRKEFKSFYKTDSLSNSLNEMLNYLALESNESAELVSQQLQSMVLILTRMKQDGYSFKEPETISQRLEPGVCLKNEAVDSGCVARARGLPWHSSDQDIARFFCGLDIGKGGVALCLTAMGRRNGEALIRFVSQEHRDLALKRHRHHMGQRYIEVYRATGEDFLNVAGGNNDEAYAFLSRGFQEIVRMRGLPYDCTPKQIIEFFGQANPPITVLGDEQGILLVKKPDGRATGDAFVLFATEEIAFNALEQNRRIIGYRYVELFRSSTAEVQQVLNRTMDPNHFIKQAHPTSPPTLLNPLAQFPSQRNLSASLLSTTSSSQARKDCVRLRGLPFEAKLEHILDFLGDHSRNIVWQGVHMVYNSENQPSGEAFIQMNSEQSAFLCASQKHHKNVIMNDKQRYIEVFQSSVDDMVMAPQVIHQAPPISLNPALSKQAFSQLRWRPDLAHFGAATLAPGLSAMNVLQNPIGGLEYIYPHYGGIAATGRIPTASLLSAMPPLLVPPPLQPLHQSNLNFLKARLLAQTATLPLTPEQSGEFL